MDLRKLKKLIDLVEESGIAELEITEGEEKVRITRQASGQNVIYASHPMQHMVASASLNVAHAAPAAEPVVAPEAEGHAVKSPTYVSNRQETYLKFLHIYCRTSPDRTR